MGELIINSPKYGEHTVLFDDEDYDKIKNHTWSVSASHKKDGSITFYAYRSSRRADEIGLTVCMHRIITNAAEDEEVDHKNHNGLDNRKENLRITTQKNNSRSRKIYSRGTSQYKGVSKWDDKDSWRAVIGVDEKSIYLGTFEKEEDAAHQYDYYAIKYFGEFAVLNFPEYDYSTYNPYIKKTKEDRSSKFFGVQSRKGKFRVVCCYNNKIISVGTFATELEAARAYNQYIIDNNLDKKLNDLPD